MEMKTCSLCQASFESEAKVCSQSCETILELKETCETFILETPATDDPRIFFYPLSFGELADFMTKLSILRSRAKTIQCQQQTDYRIFKCRRSLETHIGQFNRTKTYRMSLANLFSKLFDLNAFSARLFDLMDDARLDGEARDAIASSYCESHKMKLKIINELDQIASGKPHVSEIINGIER